MPAAIAFYYGLPGGLPGQFDHVGPYFDERRAQSMEVAPPTGPDMPLSAVPALVEEVHRVSGLPVEWIAREKDEDGSYRLWIGVTPGETVGLPEQGSPLFQGYGDPVQLRLEERSPAGAGEATLDVMTSLHFGHFGGWAVKWIWFISGLVGCVMIATGLVLFTVKRRARSLGEFGRATPAVYRAIEAINVAAIAGVTLASAAYFWANRLLPLNLPARPEAEIRAFFIVWLISLVHAFLRPRHAWREQFGLAAVLCLALPLLNLITTGDWLVAQAARGDWPVFGLEVTALAMGVTLAVLAIRIRRKTA